MNGLWDVVFAQQASEEYFGRLSITVFLQEDIKHGPLFIYRSPQPVFDPANDNMHLIQMPPGTPTGFPMTQFFGQEWGKFDVPLAKSFVTDVNSSLMEQLLNVTLAERKAVVKPQSIPNHAQGEAVSIGLAVSHSLAAYQRLVARTVLRYPRQARKGQGFHIRTGHGFQADIARL